MSQQQLCALQAKYRERFALLQKAKSVHHEAAESLNSVERDASAQLAPIVAECIDRYNAAVCGGKERIARNAYAHVNLETMRLSVIFDITHHPLYDGHGKLVKYSEPMTKDEELQVAHMLTPSIELRLREGGYKVQVERVEYDWNI